MNFRQGQNLSGSRRDMGPLRSVGLLLLVVAAAGAAYPHLYARPPSTPAGMQADAIFVLSGGDKRIPAGYMAWKEGMGKELYILGTKVGARIERILPGSQDLSSEALRRLHVEGWSENTLENAFAAKGVVAERNFRQVIMVTSDYHMPRAYLVLRTLLPGEVGITAYSVRSDWSDRNALPRTLRHFFVEGWKYWGYRLFLWAE